MPQRIPIQLLEKVVDALRSDDPMPTVHPDEFEDSTGDWHFEWTNYFGATTSARVIRSKQTGKPMLVEFREVND